MLRKLISIFVVVYAAAPAWAQVSVTFQQEVNGYLGTVDTTFRAADPLGQTSVPPPDIADFVSVDEFDGGFQTQGALRFEGLFGGAAGPSSQRRHYCLRDADRERRQRKRCRRRNRLPPRASRVAVE